MSQILKPKKGYKKVKGLFGKEIEIPEEWEIKKIEYVIKLIQSGVSRLLSPEDIGYVVATSGNIQNGRFVLSDLKYWYKIDTKGVDLTDYILDENDILLNFINSLAQIGKSCIFEKQERDWIFTTNLFRIKSKSNILQKYLYYVLNTNAARDQINAITQPAINQASFSQASFKKIKIFLPTIQEQQKIASILSRVDAYIESTQKVIEKTILLKRGLMQKLLTKGIGHTKFKKVKWLFGKEIEIPEEWEITNLSNICHIRESNQVKFDLYVGLEHIGQNDNRLVGRGNIKEFTSNKNSFHKNDVLYGKLRPLLNKVWLATEDGYCSTDILPLQVNEKITPTLFLLILTDSRFFWYAISTSSGTKMPRTNWSDMQNFKVFLPPILEQQKIALILSNVDSQIQSQTQYKEKLERLKKSLMQKLLTGQVRVTI